MGLKQSAGLLMYRVVAQRLQVLLVHPGGPYFANKDLGSWTVPKGEVAPDEDLFATALREFQEETGIRPNGPFLTLSPIKQKGGKVVHVWAFKGDCDPSKLESNTFQMEWPPKSGHMVEFPEIDQAQFFDLETAAQKIIPAQIPLLEELDRKTKSDQAQIE